MAGLDPYGIINKWLRASMTGDAAEAARLVGEGRAKDPGLRHAVTSRLEAAATLRQQSTGEEAASYEREEQLLQKLLEEIR